MEGVMVEYLLIVLAVFLFYGRTLWYSLVVDDISWYGKRMKSPMKWRGWCNVSGYIRDKLYGGCTFGFNTVVDHMVTMVGHAIVSCLIYAVFGGWVGFWAGMLYAVNPYNNQVSIWLNGRRYQVVVILCLLALLFKPWGLGLWLLTPLFQLTGFFLPVLWMDVSPWILFISLVPAFLMRKRIRGVYEARRKLVQNSDQTTWHVGRLIVVVKSFGFYFFKMIYPGVTMMNYPVLIEWGVTKAGNEDAYRLNWDFWKGVFAFVGVIFIVMIAPLRLYGLFILLGILQWSAVVSMFQQLADRYMSVVNVFMMYVIAWVCYQYGGGWYGGWLCALLFVYYATQLNVTMRMYRTIDDFYEYQMYHEPGLARNRIVYADTYLQAQDPTRAWLIVERGLFYKPNDFELLYLAAKCSACVGMIDRAEEFLKKAEQNFYVEQEKFQVRKVEGLRATMVQIVNMRGVDSRQVKRAKDRSLKKS